MPSVPPTRGSAAPGSPRRAPATEMLDILGEGGRIDDVRPRALGPVDLDDLLDAARTRRHHGDAVGEIDRLAHVVGDEHHRRPGVLRLDPPAALPCMRPRVCASRRAGQLVRVWGSAGSTARVRAMATRCFMPPESCDGKLSSGAREMDELDQVLGAAFALRLGDAHLFEAIENVLAHRLPGEEREILKHDAAIGARTRHRLVVDGNATGLDWKKSPQEIQQGALAAARRPEQRHEFAVAHRERHIVECQHRPPSRRAIDMSHVAEDDPVGHFSHPVRGFLLRAAGAEMRPKETPLSTCARVHTGPASYPCSKSTPKRYWPTV